MTQAEKLSHFSRRLNDIQNSTMYPATKQLMIMDLQADMEVVFDIPVLYCATFASNYPEVMRMYYEIKGAKEENL